MRIHIFLEPFDHLIREVHIIISIPFWLIDLPFEFIIEVFWRLKVYLFRRLNVIFTPHRNSSFLKLLPGYTVIGLI